MHFKKSFDDAKKGLPLYDERSKKVLNLAFEKSFLISVWWLLILSWISDEWNLIEFRDVSQALGAGILGMVIILGVCWLYYNRKQDLVNVC